MIIYLELPLETCLLMTYEAQMKMLQLTVGISGNDRIRLQRNSRSELVDSSNPEDVLIVLDQSAAHAGQGLAFGFHDDPVESAGLAALHNVMGDAIAAVLQGDLPGYRTLFLCHSGDQNLISRWSRSV